MKFSLLGITAMDHQVNMAINKACGKNYNGKSSKMHSHEHHTPTTDTLIEIC